ncbi:MAG TPA: response regulator [Pyrinomonadaceae bacterium]|nr:response regulator [Pyrinomonadaceae bacterium]HMP66762.1 response regulator [Pyrinomonadaceae bacterium]
MAKRKIVPRPSNLVFIVEDDQTIARLLRHWLVQRGFEVEILPDGRVAIETLATVKPPRMVFLDIMMPFADGFEVLSNIRSKKDWSKVPVIMITSRSSEDSIVRAFEAGANDYVTKPFKPGELMVRMNRLLV